MSLQKEGSAKIVKESVTVGIHLNCKWRDGQFYECEVLKIREKENVVEYYVHYVDFNRRLDEWVTIERFAAFERRKRKRFHDELIPSRSSKGESKSGSKISKIPRKSTTPLFERSKDKERDRDKDREKNLTEEEKYFEQVYRVRNFPQIQLGQNIMETWYFSPYPKEYVDNCKDDLLRICEFCLKATPSRYAYERHVSKCQRKYPPGQEIYRNGNISFFEVDGAIEIDYCRNLSLIAKFFLDHKTLYFDVDPFLFYVLCQIDASGFHIVGYFSKEKDSQYGNNLACILTLPAYQRMGFGRVLINFSYELSKKENKIGSPETPLSDLGLLSYRSFWSSVLIDLLKQYEGNELSIENISSITCFKTEDILSTLKALDLIKYSKGQYVLCLTSKLISEQEHLKSKEKQKPIDPKKLHWTPIDWASIKAQQQKKGKKK